ncbi:hypothetical protein DLP05_146 [Stenotrophomonas phage vB_SmaS_DLP_5]|uniref:Uncharacterized protein n=1 Tax=Stenotrophomonas phage vB_SmaS_DLP_5 TaxID=2044561 RepID=A0A2D2W2G8_9CAUD|nr:hypothetical protein FDJ07_gp075 [Stenotrophomonas phage vB_SmaS_DLP_5]ATS92335.1 hypothetical protein DLP05_146 [Stenotrophomonas phage vB_SmaS_DLP_5]
MSNVTCLFPVADALDIPLFESLGSAKGAQVRTMAIGPWGFKSDIMFESDHFDGNTASGLVKLRKELWAYVIYDRASQELMWAMIKKPEGLKTNHISEFLRSDGALEKIRKAVKAVFVSKKRGNWERVETSDLDKRLSGEGVQRDSTGADEGADPKGTVPF